MKKPGEVRHCCVPCGEKAMERANIAPPTTQVIAATQGRCDACGVTTTIAHVSVFGYAFAARPRQTEHWT